MKPTKLNLLPSFAAVALLALTASANAATLSYADATIVSDNFVNASDSGAVGRQTDNKTYRALAAFSVQDIITNDPLIATIADFSTYTFNFSFDTINSATLNAGSYKVEYVGFFANGTFANTGNGTNLGSWGGKYTNPTVQLVNTGVADTLALQTDITATGFTLSGVTEANTANDTILFRVHYSEAMNQNVFQTLGGYTLTAIPEPSTALLGGLGMLVLVLRRRR